MNSFLEGAMSELSSSIVYVPFEVVRTRLQLGSNPNLVTNGFIKNESNYRNTVNALVSIGAREVLFFFFFYRFLLREKSIQIVRVVMLL